MNINLKWSEVVDIEPRIETDDIFSIVILFKDNSHCIYTYRDSDKFIKDYTNLMIIKRG
jgi:hypothetical protein